MPKFRKGIYSKKPAPNDYLLIEPTLIELNDKLKETINESHKGKRKGESIWPIIRINHQISRFLYEKYYFDKEISSEAYEYSLSEGYGDKNLIAKWKKLGYEKLCCLICIQKKDHNFNTTCICRVPKSKLNNNENENKIIECNHCGCKGCASSDI